jgi:hypothetical protein
MSIGRRERETSPSCYTVPRCLVVSAVLFFSLPLLFHPVFSLHQSPLFCFRRRLQLHLKWRRCLVLETSFILHHRSQRTRPTIDEPLSGFYFFQTRLGQPQTRLSARRKGLPFYVPFSSPAWRSLWSDRNGSVAHACGETRKPGESALISSEQKVRLEGDEPVFRAAVRSSRTFPFLSTHQIRAASSHRSSPMSA